MTGFVNNSQSVYFTLSNEKTPKCIKKKLSDKKRFIIGNINSLCGVARQKQ